MHGRRLSSARGEGEESNPCWAPSSSANTTGFADTSGNRSQRAGLFGGKSKSLPPWITIIGGTSAVTHDIGDAASQRSVGGERRFEDDLGEELLEVGTAGAVAVDEVVHAVQRDGVGRRIGSSNPRLKGGLVGVSAASADR